MWPGNLSGWICRHLALMLLTQYVMYTACAWTLALESGHSEIMRLCMHTICA